MIIAATGHRPHTLGAPYGHDTARRTLRAYFAQHTPSLVLSGMAQGWDLDFAYVANEMGIPFEAIVPFPSQSRNWAYAEQALHTRLCERATRVVTIAPDPYSLAKMQARNTYLIRRATRVCALWNGTHSGGTAHAIGLTRRYDKPLDNLYDAYMTLLNVGTVTELS